jgi:hypothetical protein
VNMANKRPGVVYLDPASMHNEILRRHPEIDPFRSRCYVNNTLNSGAFATVSDCSNVPDGVEVEIGDRIKEDYHGFTVDIVRWRVKKKRRPRRCAS